MAPAFSTFLLKIHTSLFFAGKVGAYPSGAPSNTAIKYKTKMEETDSDTLEINYGHKKFYYGGP